MSFQQKGLWLPRDAGCVNNGEMSYENSGKMEPKRGHQWFVDGTSPQAFSNKRQAVEIIGSRPGPDITSMSIPSWDSNANFQGMPGQFSDRLFGSEPVRPGNIVDRNMAPLISGDIGMGRKYIEEQFANDSSVNLSMSHNNEDPSSLLNFGGHRKVKINQVREPEINISASMGNSYGRPGDSVISYKTDGNTISLGPVYQNKDQNNATMGAGYNKASQSFIPMSQSQNFGKEGGSFMSMGQNYNKGTENLLSMAQPFRKGDGGFISMGETYRKIDTNAMSMGLSYNKEQSNFMSMGPSFGKPGENLFSMAPSFSKGNDSLMSIGQTFQKGDANLGPLGGAYEKADSGTLTMGHNYKDSSALSFGEFGDDGNASGTIIGNYEIVIDNEGSVQGSEMPCPKEVVDPNPDRTVNSTTASNSRNDNPPKNKEPKAVKKVPANNFPSNVKSLLSTGLLDGVPVKYVSWSREKNLKAVIRGTGYLCGCNECNHSKTLNAYEFERHAGCKTKHPNNHIYFENGKTIYAVVQELKNTPQETLFDVIQNITGSPINQKNFRAWKASYQAATRELQRIYGKDEVKMPC